MYSGCLMPSAAGQAAQLLLWGECQRITVIKYISMILNNELHLLVKSIFVKHDWPVGLF